MSTTREDYTPSLTPADEKLAVDFILSRLGEDVVEQLEEKQLQTVVNIKLNINNLKIALDKMEYELLDAFKEAKPFLRQAIHYLQMEPARKSPSVFYRTYCEDVPKHLAKAQEKLLLAKTKVPNEVFCREITEFHEAIGEMTNYIAGITAKAIKPSSAGIMVAIGADAKIAPVKKATAAKPPLVPIPVKCLDVNLTSIGDVINKIDAFKVTVQMLLSTIPPNMKPEFKKIYEALNKSPIKNLDQILNTFVGQFVNLRKIIFWLDEIKTQEEYSKLDSKTQEQINLLQINIQNLIVREPEDVTLLVAKHLINGITDFTIEAALARTVLLNYADKMLRQYNELKQNSLSKKILIACTSILRGIKHELQHGNLDIKKIQRILISLSQSNDKDTEAARNMSVIQDFNLMLNVLVKKASMQTATATNNAAHTPAPAIHTV